VVEEAGSAEAEAEVAVVALRVAEAEVAVVDREVAVVATADTARSLGKNSRTEPFTER